MAPSLPLLLDERHLPLGELTAARLDGDLRELAGGYCSVDVRPCLDLRAAALAPMVPDGLVVERMTAAWLHGATPLFRRPVQLCVRSDHRVRAHPSTDRLVRQVVLAEREITRAGTLLTTRPFRTAIDLLRWEHTFDRSTATTVTTLLLAARATPPDVARALSRVPHLPHKLRALDRLTTLPAFAGGTR